MKNFDQYFEDHFKNTRAQVRYYLFIDNQSARKYTNINTFENFKSWADSTTAPLLMFEGTATDEIFAPEGYDWIILTDLKQVAYYIYKHYYLKNL